jgi:hypothetical protein
MRLERIVSSAPRDRIFAWRSDADLHGAGYVCGKCLDICRHAHAQRRGNTFAMLLEAQVGIDDRMPPL